MKQRSNLYQKTGIGINYCTVLTNKFNLKGQDGNNGSFRDHIHVDDLEEENKTNSGMTDKKKHSKTEEKQDYRNNIATLFATLKRFVSRN